MAIFNPSPRQKSNRGCASILGVFATLLVIGAIVFFFVFPKGVALGSLLPFGLGNIISPPPTTNGIIDISFGEHALDTNRPDGTLKQQASAQFQAGHTKEAVSLWNQAHTMEPNDAEPSIYLEDQRVLTSGKPFITLAIGAMLTGDDGAVGSGRDNLQGAYIAQKEYNEGFKLGNTEVRLLITNANSDANASVNTKNVTAIAQKIVQVAQHDKIVGVMGWAYSAYTSDAIGILDKAHIPLVSATSSSDTLTGRSTFFFRVAPSNNSQAVAGAQYAEQKLNVKSVALFFDPKNVYSKSLADDFTRQFVNVDHKQIIDTEEYTVGKKDNLSLLLRKALSRNPDLIYFSGYTNDMNVLLTDLPPGSSNVQLMGGDALYELNGYQVSASANFPHLHFTAFAYPDTWGYLGMGTREHPFFSEYSRYFDPGNNHPGRSTYGYSRSDSDAILSYDATTSLLQGCSNALNKQSPLTPEAVQRGLTQITGAQGIQGASGQISFGTNGDPIGKAVVILDVDPTGRVKLSPNGSAVKGCFLLTQHCNT